MRLEENDSDLVFILYNNWTILQVHKILSTSAISGNSFLPR